MTRSTTLSRYDDDFHAWTQEQADLLRRMPAAKGVDIANVAEEIEDLGKTGLRKVESHLAWLFEHLIKIGFLSSSPSLSHWLEEASTFHSSMMQSFAPSMRRGIDLDWAWRAGARRAAVALDDAGVVARPHATCPFSLDELLSETFDHAAAATRLAASGEAAS